MTLKNYVLNGPSTVILADNRDPMQSWQRHLDKAGRGGIDLVAVIGTPVYAPTDGTWRWLKSNGSAGNSGEFFHDDNPGWRDVFSHLSRYVGWSGKHFEQGQIIAYTGNTGGVDQHLHRHLLDPQGNRQNPWLYFTATSTASGDITPITEKEQEYDMKLTHYVKKVVDVPGEAGVRDATYKNANILFLYGDLFIREVSQTEANLLAKTVGSSMVTTPAGIALLEKIVAENLASLPSGTGGAVDMALIESAIERGAAKALDGLTVTINTD